MDDCMETCRERAEYNSSAYSLVGGGVRDADPVTELVEEAEYAYRQAAQASGVRAARIPASSTTSKSMAR